jgi:hypothetical protein
MPAVRMTMSMVQKGLSLKTMISKHILNIFIILLLFSTNVKAQDKVVNEMLSQGNVKTGLGVDQRYSQGAFAMDLAKCSGILAAGSAQAIQSYSACLPTFASKVGTILAAGICLPLSGATGFLAMYSAYEVIEVLAWKLRRDTKVVNTINKDKKNTCVFKDNSLNNKDNFGSDFTEKNIINKDDLYYWKHSGPLGDYCYKEEYDHTLPKNKIFIGFAEDEADLNKKKYDIYNNGYGKIGISIRGKEPFWLAPYECTYKEGEHYCAWLEGSYICAESVWCTGLIGGDIMPIRGYIGDPEISSSARRKCGYNPFEGESETVDDFQVNKRCECYCCEGSDNYQECDLLKGSRTCRTFNERYRTHCVKLPPKDEELPPSTLPGNVSAYCYSNVKSGYKDFPFIGKAMRCFEQTLKNIYFGQTDSYNNDIGQDGVTSELVIKKICINNLVNEDGTCTKSIYNLVRKDLENFVALILTLSLVLIGIRFTIAAGLSWGQLVIQFFKIGLVLYFVQGNAWKDGYYDFLTRGAYELSEEFFKVTLKDKEAQVDLNKLLEINKEDDEKEELSDDVIELKRSCNIVEKSELVDKVAVELENCNFLSGFHQDGTAYRDDERHYAILDSLDCKFSKYIGMTKNNVFPNIIKIAMAILFSKASGLFFFITAMVFLFAAIIFMLKITLMLATAVVMINFFIIISPIMIPMILIGSTKKFFDKWLNTLIGYSLQPFLVLALISLLLLLIDYFYGYIAVIYDYDVTYIQNNNLGINMPRIDDLNTSDSIAYLLQFLFLLIVIIHIFDKFAQILSHLSGAGSVTNIVQAPNFEGQLKKGVKFIGKNIKRSAAATASAAGLASSAKKSGQGEGKDQENDVGNENRNINSESNSLGQDGSSSDGQGGSSNQNVQ